MVRCSALVLVLVAAACGGDDSGGGGGDGADGGGGGGDGACAGTVAGTSSGGFSGCVTAINEFPEGDDDIQEAYWIYSLVAAPETDSELDEPLESLGMNLLLPGAPAAGSYDLTDTLPDSTAFVYAPYPTAYEDLSGLSLTVDSMEMVSEMDFGGHPLISYTLHGELELMLAGTGGAVTLTATF